MDDAIAKCGQNKTWARAVRGVIRQQDFLTACDVIKNAMGPTGFADYMRERFLVPQFQPAPIHDTLINIDVRVVLTPNYDKIFETHINAVQNSSVVVKNYYDDDIADAIRSSGRVVLKVHGTIDTPKHVIFTRTDYARARQQHRAFYFVLDALATTNTFLFVGCGLNDPDMRLMLEDHAFRSVHYVPHYVVLPRTEVKPQVADALEESLGIKLILFDPRNNYADFHASMSDLESQVIACRQSLTIAEW